MIAEPTILAVTTPVGLTVATVVLLLFHVTFLFAALDGTTAAFKVIVLPTSTDTVAGVIVIPDTGISIGSGPLQVDDISVMASTGRNKIFFII
jgi:hypothetical protein